MVVPPKNFLPAAGSSDAATSAGPTRARARLPQSDRNLFLGSATENSVILPTIACPHGFKSRKRLLETANQPSDGRFGQTVSDNVVLCQP